MSAKTGLLLVTNPKQIAKILPSIPVQNILYIQLISALTEPFGNFYTNIFNSWPKYSQIIQGIYSQAAISCKTVDVRVLLSGLKYKNLTQIQTSNKIDLIIFDKHYDNETEVTNFVTKRIGNLSNNYNTLTVDPVQGKSQIFDYKPSLNENDSKIYKHSVLGGTFDRLHIAHKLMLSEAVLRTDSKITIGVTETNMLQNKILWELIEPIDKRIKNVENFLKDICNELEYNVVPITDPFGPSVVDPTMDLLVVSEETAKMANKINEIRENKKLNRLDIKKIDIIEESERNDSIEETKISSSTSRIRLLGTLLNPVENKNDIPRKPYVIGLTGGIASGKSGVAEWLSKLNVEIINCDLLGHAAYVKGTNCYQSIVKHFGSDKILAENGEINRRALGEIVFKNPKEMETLNSLVWPEIENEITRIIRTTSSDVIVVEAAILLKAGWQKHCHEIWSTIIPRNEIINRLKTRNGLTEEQAIDRINSQPLNMVYVENSNVIFCTLWDRSYTKLQVDRAWKLLKERLNQS